MIKADKTEVKLEWVKATKNTEVYGTDAQSAAISQLYIQKSAFEGEAPEAIIVTIKEA